MAVIRYKTGFPTRVDTPTLDRMLRALGAPTVIERLPAFRIRIEWAPIYPGVPIPEWRIAEPWSSEKGKIEIESITID